MYYCLVWCTLMGELRAMSSCRSPHPDGGGWGGGEGGAAFVTAPSPPHTPCYHDVSVWPPVVVVVHHRWCLADSLTLGRRWHVQPCCVVTGEGLVKGFTWLMDAMDASG